MEQLVNVNLEAGNLELQTKRNEMKKSRNNTIARHMMFGIKCGKNVNF